MAARISQRRSIHSGNARLNFRGSVNDNPKSERKGTTPTSTPTSFREIATLMVLHLCRKSLFYDTNIKVAIYLGSLFLISLIADVSTIPKIYLSRSSNVLNQYFVKFAWAWNLILLIPYVGLTTYTYCCGQRDQILKSHFTRLGIATFFWWFWTTLFQFIEFRYGKCSFKGEHLNSKQSCLKGGYVWNGFDISGHSFILIYGSLLFIEETRSLINWDSIKDHIRLEDHYRSTKDKTLEDRSSNHTNPLRVLSDKQFKFLQLHYEKFTPYIRGLFVVITVFQLLWDVMLVSTMLYFHVMVEKFLGGVIAILTWYFTYRFWYTHSNLLPNLPGDGLFKYMKSRQQPSSVQSSGRRRAGSIVLERNQTPNFMGIPIYNGISTTAQAEDR